jgi:FAD synthase
MTSTNKELTKNLVPGVYTAIGKFINPTNDSLNDAKYMCALSIGWNPVYDNAEKTVEVYIMHDFGELEFYGQTLEVDIKSFLRAEALFSSFDDLILAIHCDVEAARSFLSVI